MLGLYKRTLLSSPRLLAYFFLMALLVVAVAVLSLVQLEVVVEASPLPNNTTALSTPSTSSNKGVCSYDDLLNSLEKIVNQSEPGIKYLGDIPGYAATSCHQIASVRPEATSGHYWIQEDSGPARVYCALEGVACGGGEWMQVADVNMTVTSSRCPAGLQKVTSPKSLCRKTVSGGCSSASFSTHGVPFSKICGRVTGYQYSSPDAFTAYYHNQDRTIDELYVDGVSITHSTVPRQHIWTLAAAPDEFPGHSIYACPCTNSISHVAYTGLIPEFISNDYYCETASRISVANRYYLEDPLWDGQGCGRFSSCCEGELKPWFYKNLSQSVTSDIEVRVCAREAGSDVLLEIISLYVQ